MTHPAILVLIINYKTSSLIQNLVDSISENVDIAILVIDNSSTNETYEELKKVNDKRVRLLRSEKNLGFTGGINFGLKHVMEKMPYITHFFLFNPDALSSANLIINLYKIIQSEQHAAAVSPRILYSDGRLWYSGAALNISKGKVYNNPTKLDDATSAYYDVDVFSGCAVLFDLEKVIEVGMFNEDLFMYYDEADLSIKLKAKGFRILYAPLLTIYHDVSYTTKSLTHLKTYYMTRNKFIVFNKRMSLYNKMYFMLYELAYHIKNGRAKNAIYHLRGFYDFLRGKKGSY